ncbi:MAG TPA: hypothetical protein VMM35_09570 [Longimicrobiales bacterium]|nr:hypothetical protein [Longimicrobiales bacterium]
MIVFLDRRRRAGPFLEWKVRVFVVAAALGLAGIYLEERWLTGSAIVLLFAGLTLRFLPTGESDESDDEDDEEDAGAP